MGNTTIVSRKRIPTPEQLALEAKVLELRQQHLSFTKIAEHPDVQLYDRGSAHKIYTRALARVHAEPAAEVRQLESSRLDRMGEILWAILLDDKKQIETRLKVVDRIIRLMERRAKLLGLDHEHGIAERSLALEADKVRLMAVAFGGAMDFLAEHVDLSPVVTVDGEAASLRDHVSRMLIAKLRAAEQSVDVDDDDGPVHVVTDVGTDDES